MTILDNDSTGGDPCAGISITAGANNTIVVNGLNAQYSKVKVLNSAFATVFSQTYTTAPGTVTVPTLPSGTYSVKVTVMQSNLSTIICTKEVSITTGNTPNTPTVSISDVTVNENAGTASLTVSLSAPSSTPTTVTVTTSNGTATSGTDYTPVTMTITIPAGATSASVTFPIVDDATGEPTEVFNATLSNPSGATIADGSGTVTILDNDGTTTPPTVSISDVTVNENAGTASLTVSLSAPSSTPTTVTVTTSNGTATSGTDYTPVTMTVTIPAGATSATVTFPIVDDATGEPTEVFNATLSNPSGATIADGSGTVNYLR